MMTVAEHPVQERPTRPPPVATAAVQRQVMIVVDACCELAPSAIAESGILVMPRVVRAGRKTITLDAAQTLHHSCWQDVPRAISPAPYALGELARQYEQVLREGTSVLALHQPAHFDGAAAVALAARSILLAGISGDKAHAPRIAVYELGAVGLGYSFLLDVAARGAAEGLSLAQLLTLLDHTQTMLRHYFVTDRHGPRPAVRHATRDKAVARFGREQLWELNRSTDGLFACRMRARQLGPQLFGPDGLLEGQEPTVVRSSHARLLDRLNTARSQLQLAALDAQPGGLSVHRYSRTGMLNLPCCPTTTPLAV